MTNVVRLPGKAETDLPKWLDRELWSDYCDQRQEIAATHKGKRYPWTHRQQKYALRSLERLIVDAVGQGWKPDEAQAAIFEQTLANGWVGFWAPRR